MTHLHLLAIDQRLQPAAMHDELPPSNDAPTIVEFLERAVVSIKNEGTGVRSD